MDSIGNRTHVLKRGLLITGLLANLSTTEVLLSHLQIHLLMVRYPRFSSAQTPLTPKTKNNSSITCRKSKAPKKPECATKPSAQILQATLFLGKKEIFLHE